MTNYEKNEEFIKQAMLQTGTCHFGVRKDNNEIVYCNSIDCYLCKFITSESSCMENRAEWLKKEAEPPICEQLMDVIRDVLIECSDIPCDECVYHTLNNICRRRESCLAGRIADAVNGSFKVTNKEDKIDE